MNFVAIDIETIPATLLFALIGATPHTDWLAGVVQRDDKGFILTGQDVDLSTWPLQRNPMNLSGIFASDRPREFSLLRNSFAPGNLWRNGEGWIFHLIAVSVHTNKSALKYFTPKTEVRSYASLGGCKLKLTSMTCDCACLCHPHAGDRVHNERG